MTKAFDTVHHRILLSKLEKSGVWGTAVDWFASYLSNREYFVKIDSCVFSTQFISIGLAQGRILDPILFLVYVNDLPNVSYVFWLNPFMPTVAFNICCPRDCVSRHNVGTRGVPIMPRDAVSRTANVERNGGHKWVKDDTTVSIPDSSEESFINKINNELYKIQQRTISNQPSVNADKSELPLITKRCVDRNQFNVFLRDDRIELESHCKFLGVFIDEGLNIGIYVEHVCIRQASKQFR